MNIGQRIVGRLRRGYKIVLSRQAKKVPNKGVPIGQSIIKEGKYFFYPFGVLPPVKPKPPVKKLKKIEGIEISEVFPRKVKFGKLKVRERAPAKEITYPLIPKNPMKGQPIFAYAHIFWDKKLNRYIYELNEPRLSEKLNKMMKKIKELLEQRLDIDFSKLRISEAGEYLNKQINELIEYFGFQTTAVERQILRYYIERDFIGLGKIEPLMQDPNIEDVSCDGVGTPIFVFHRNPDIASVVTNVIFDNSDELDSFITRLAQLTGKTITVAEPLLDGTLADGSRVQATLATDIARKGSNFTIRKFTKEPMTPVHLMNYGTVDARALAYLWMAVDYGRSILVSGGTASGKTTLLNVLSLFIRPDKKIVSIEDTAELRLPHPHWVPTVARTAISKGRKGEVTLFDLLKESFRQRPDYIIVGEVRGKEAFILFQQIATGHPSLATIHAENMPKLTDRLTTAPISLPPQLVSSLDLVVFMQRMRYKEKFTRRLTEILEMIEFDPETKRPIVNRIFKWSPTTDRFDVVNKSVIFKKISDLTGISPQELIEELKRRILVLEWMQEKNITDYRDVYKVINLYYTSPNRVLAVIMGES